MQLRPGEARPIMRLVIAGCCRGGRRPASCVLSVVRGPPHPSASPGRLRPPPSARSVPGAGWACRPAPSCLSGLSVGPPTFAPPPSHLRRGWRQAAVAPCAERAGVSLGRRPRRRVRGVPFLALRPRPARFVRNTAALWAALAAGACARDGGSRAAAFPPRPAAEAGGACGPFRQPSAAWRCGAKRCQAAKPPVAVPPCPHGAGLRWGPQPVDPACAPAGD